MSNYTVELVSIRTPNYIQAKFPSHSSWCAVQQLSVQAISDLCDEFREHMFIKAGKTDPRKA